MVKKINAGSIRWALLCTSRTEGVTIPERDAACWMLLRAIQQQSRDDLSPHLRAVGPRLPGRIRKGLSEGFGPCL